MTIKIVAAARYLIAVDFRGLEAARDGREQYSVLTADDVLECRWRADIVVA